MNAMKNHERQFDVLLDELQRWNRRCNLTAIRERGAMAAAHIEDSLAVRDCLHGRRILDVGTGAGFPGLPLAIAEPQRAFVLLDGNNRKIQFVAHVARRLRLRNVDAVHARAEDYAPAQRFDTVMARAVGSLAQLLAIAGRHVAAGGVFVALKGRYPAAELRQLPADWDATVAALKISGAHSRHAALMRRAQESG